MSAFGDSTADRRPTASGRFETVGRPEATVRDRPFCGRPDKRATLTISVRKVVNAHVALEGDRQPMAVRRELGRRNRRFAARNGRQAR